jgi:hypothetical protein
VLSERVPIGHFATLECVQFTRKWHQTQTWVLSPLADCESDKVSEAERTTAPAPENAVAVPAGEMAPIAPLFASSGVGAVVSLAVLVAPFVAGERFAVRLPHAHLADLRVPLEHGEVVLLVDVPFRRVREIEHLVSQRHPEVGVGGVGWIVEALGV